MRIVITVVAVLAALPGIATAAYFAVLTVASLAFRERKTDGPVGRLRFLVVVPAHDESTVIGVTLTALRGAMRDGDLLVVVADHCTDDTAAIARVAGAIVVERTGDEPQGRAEARQAGLDRARDLEWDALVTMDADSVVAPDFLDACERALGAGAVALQPRLDITRGRSLVEQASLAAYAVQALTLARGRDVLRCAVRLRGVGMVVRRDVLAEHTFRAPASEDLFFSLDLCLAGVRPRHLEAARVHSLMPRDWRTTANQRVRYEAGRLAAAKEFVRPLLASRSFAGLEAAWFLLTPPFATAAFSLLVGGALAWLGGATALVVVTAVGLAVLGATVAVALVQARASLRTWLALVAAPWYVLWKVPVYARAALSVRRRQAFFEPTRR